MKPTTINVQITKNPKQFEAVRIGLEATLEPNETVEGAIKEATAQLNSIYAEMYNQQPKVAQNAEKTAKNAPEPTADKREKLTFDDPRVQQIIKRIEKEPKRAAEILEQTHKYFAPDEQAEKVLQTAAQFNNKL